jgi:hypothetical protein
MAIFVETLHFDEAAPGRERLIGALTSCAVHLLIASVALWSARGVIGEAVQSGGREPAVFVVSMPEPPGLPGLRAMDPAEMASITAPGNLTALDLGNFTFNLEKIVERRALLFPFVSPGLDLHQFGVTEASPSDHLDVPWNLLLETSGDTRRKHRPLMLDANAIQAIVDKSWARKERWEAFQHVQQFTAAQSADEGSLPALLRAYTDQNGLQPYADPGARDPQFWTELGLAADHMSFIEFISKYARDNPGTKATTELLFLLDKIAFASRDAIAYLLDTDASLDLTRTYRSDPVARAFAADLWTHYSTLLKARGLETPEKLGRFYDDLRIEILDAIVRTSPAGYRASDARFLEGGIYWKQQRFNEALREWDRLGIDADSSYAIAIRELNAALGQSAATSAAAGGLPRTIERGEIDRILAAEHGRWVDFSIDRLKKFGYRVDTY